MDFSSVHNGAVKSIPGATLFEVAGLCWSGVDVEDEVMSNE